MFSKHALKDSLPPWLLCPPEIRCCCGNDLFANGSECYPLGSRTCHRADTRTARRPRTRNHPWAHPGWESYLWRVGDTEPFERGGGSRIGRRRSGGRIDIGDRHHGCRRCACEIWDGLRGLFCSWTLCCSPSKRRKPPARTVGSVQDRDAQDRSGAGADPGGRGCWNRWRRLSSRISQGCLGRSSPDRKTISIMEIYNRSRGPQQINIIGTADNASTGPKIILYKIFIMHKEKSIL